MRHSSYWTLYGIKLIPHTVQILLNTKYTVLWPWNYWPNDQNFALLYQKVLIILKEGWWPHDFYLLNCCSELGHNFYPQKKKMTFLPEYNIMKKMVLTTHFPIDSHVKIPVPRLTFFQTWMICNSKSRLVTYWFFCIYYLHMRPSSHWQSINKMTFTFFN